MQLNLGVTVTLFWQRMAPDISRLGQFLWKTCNTNAVQTSCVCVCVYLCANSPENRACPYIMLQIESRSIDAPLLHQHHLFGQGHPCKGLKEPGVGVGGGMAVCRQGAEVEMRYFTSDCWTKATFVFRCRNVHRPQAATPSKSPKWRNE